MLLGMLCISGVIFLDVFNLVFKFWLGYVVMSVLEGKFGVMVGYMKFVKNVWFKWRSEEGMMIWFGLNRSFLCMVSLWWID